jgi:hypothetical protein
MLNDTVLFIWVWLVTVCFAYQLGKERGERLACNRPNTSVPTDDSTK